MVQIVQVKNKRQLDSFIKFPFKLYKITHTGYHPLYQMKNLLLIKIKIRHLNSAMQNFGWHIRMAR